MPIDIKVPVLPESVNDATVLTWYHQPGEAVRRDDKLVDLETDKVVLEVVAPANGTLEKVLQPVGATVNANQILAVIETGASAVGDTRATAKPQPAASPTAASPPAIPLAPAAPAATRAADPVVPPAAAGDRPPPGPAARRLLEQHELDPSLIPGTGPKGRITKGDVIDFISGDARPTAATIASTPVAAIEEVPEPLPFAEAGPTPTAGHPERPEQRVPMTRLRRRIAERLVEAQQTAAMLTTFNEVDMQAVKDLRARYRDPFAKEHGIKLGFMSFFVQAVIHALRRFPLVNASIDGNDVIYHGYYDIGIAVSTPRGLVVPILRDTDRLSFAGIEQAINDLAAGARDGKLQLEQLTGGTFSITNGGIFGSLLSTPILNPPQSAILGMHTIQQRPVAVDGQVVIRPMMYLALSYDHRIVDGAEAVQFLVAVKQALEDPSRLLLEI